MARRKNLRRFQQPRNCRGSMFGLLSLVCVIPLVVLATIVSVDSNLAYCHNKKLQFILDQVTNSLADTSAPISEADAQKLATYMLQANAVPASNVKVCLRADAGKNAGTLMICISGDVKLIQNAYIPGMVHFNVSRPLPMTVTTPAAHICFDAYPLATMYPSRSPSLYVPIVKPQPKLPIWTFAPDDTIQSLYLNYGEAPKIGTGYADEYFAHMESLY